jgi:type IV pilus assembly protein PilM
VIKLGKTNVQPIGIDIGYDSIKLLQLETSSDALAVHCAASMPVPAEMRGDPTKRSQILPDMIRQMLRQNPFHGRRVVASLPRDIVHVKNLRLPVMPADELAGAIEFEARTIFSFDTESAQVRFLPAGEVRQGNDARFEVILLAALSRQVDVFLELLNQGGAIVESLDWEPSAIYRGIERFIRRREDEHEVNVLVDVGLRCSQVIIGKGRDISFFKQIDVGGRQLDEAVSRKLGITMEEARALRRRLMENNGGSAESKRDPVRQAVFDATRSIMEQLGREISLCLRYYSVTFRGHRPARVRIMGGEANDPQLLSVLHGTLPIPAEACKPLHNVKLDRMKPSERRGSLCEWGVALGLGLKLTTANFAGRTGTSRAQMSSMLEEEPSAATVVKAEVVDLNRAIDETVARSSEPAADKKLEAAHA